MLEEINNRFASLIEEGKQLVARLPRDEFGVENWAKNDDMPMYQAWLGSVTNLLRTVAGSGSYFTGECERLMKEESTRAGIRCHAVQKM